MTFVNKFIRHRDWLFTHDFELIEDHVVMTGIRGLNRRYGSMTIQCDGKLTIRKGFRWNGASGPTIDTKSTYEASCVHDALYELLSAGIIPMRYKSLIDKLLYDLIIINGLIESRVMNSDHPVARRFYQLRKKWLYFRASYWLWSVDKFGHLAI